MGNSHRHRPPGTARLVTIAVAGALLAAGCSGGNDDSSAATEAPALAAEPAIDGGAVADEDSAEGGDARDAPTAAQALPTGGFDLGQIGRQVIVEMQVTMSSPDLRSTVDGILRSAAAQGGGVASSQVDYGTEARDGQAVLVVKVPPTALPAFLAGLDVLGEVVSIGQDAQDVTEQLTDLDVRIANATRSVERVRALLTDASDLREVIDLEAELTRRQTDLERLQATARNLEDRVALSTVTIQVFPDQAAPVVDEGDDGIADAFGSGIDAFVGVLFAIALVLAVTAPFIAVLLVLGVIAWVVVRPRRRRGAASPTPEADADLNAVGSDDEPSLTR